MGVQAQQVTLAEFERVALLPANADRRLEYVRGVIVEVVSNNYASLVAARILARLVLHVEERGVGYVTGADGGYSVGQDRYIPDAAFISKAKQPDPPHHAWNPHAPHLAVEVLSPTDDAEVLRLKIASYLSTGSVVWVVNPDKQQVEVYAPGQAPQRIGADGVLSGGAVLPDFSLPVAAMFPDEGQT
jgi:Uma2 family endonuclease